MRNLVVQNASTLYSLRHALETQAAYVRLLQPYIKPEGVVELMRVANAWEWTVR